MQVHESIGDVFLAAGRYNDASSGSLLALLLPVLLSDGLLLNGVAHCPQVSMKTGVNDGAQAPAQVFHLEHINPLVLNVKADMHLPLLLAHQHQQLKPKCSPYRIQAPFWLLLLLCGFTEAADGGPLAPAPPLHGSSSAFVSAVLHAQ